jgi:beta-exotoxin I transport system permease protein
MFNLLKHELTSRWVAILGWGIGLTAYAAMYITIYPEMASEMQSLANISIYKAMGFDLASFAGYIAGVVVQLIPLILGIFVIMSSTGTLAGEEDNGTLELVVAMPLPRWQIVAMKAAALSIVLLLILMIVGASSAMILNMVSQSTEVDATPIQLFVALLGAYPMLLAFFSIGLFLGSIMPSRRLATSVMVFVYIGSYVANSVANIVESMAWLKTISLFSYVDSTVSVFTDGLNVGNMLLLLIISAIFFGLAAFSFQSRNITVGEWPWQRSKLPARTASKVKTA